MKNVNIISTQHYRYCRNGQLVPYSRKTHGKVKPNGGLTTVTVESEGKIATGDAICSSADHFDYNAGRSLAIGRAIERLGSFKIVDGQTRLGAIKKFREKND